jgi:MarR family transcriptional regulator, lower aerobic nicotinate degradation pathway regulator
MPPINKQDIAKSILQFEKQFNEKIAPLFTPLRGEGFAVTKSQAKVLFSLFHRPDQTATELGEALGRTKASLTGILDALELWNLAKRNCDSEDRRRSRVSLTPKGRKFCEAKSREMDARMEARFASFSEEERAALVRSIREATALLEKLED